MTRERVEEQPATQSGGAGLSVRWDDSSMRSTYSNACNVTGTREEIVLLFGINQAWQSGVKELTVQLQDRIILSPYAAKRLNLLLSRVLREYESRYGPLHSDVTEPGAMPRSLSTV